MEIPPTELIQLGNTVASLRLARNWSLAELGAVAGLPYDFVCDVEAGRKESTLLDIQALAKAFGITIQELLEMARL